MKTTLDQRVYITEEKLRNPRKKIIEGAQILESRNTEVGSSINARGIMEALEREGCNGHQPPLPIRTIEVVEKPVRERIRKDAGEKIREDVRKRVRKDLIPQHPTSSNEPFFSKCRSAQLANERALEEIEISTAINEAQQNISQDPTNKARILWNLFQKARILSNRHPAKKIVFEFLHTQDPANESIFEEFGRMLETQDLKAAKALYVEGLSNSKLFKVAVQHIGFIIKKQGNSPAILALKPILIKCLLDRTVIPQIQKQLKDPSDPIHGYLKEFVEEEVEVKPEPVI